MRENAMIPIEQKTTAVTAKEIAQLSDESGSFRINSACEAEHDRSSHDVSLSDLLGATSREELHGISAVIVTPS